MQSEPIEANTLDDLGDSPFTVTLTRPDGKAVKVKLRAIGEAELWGIRRSVTWPAPPIKDIQKVQNEMVEVYNYLDPAYLKATQDATRLMARRVLASMLLIKIDGETLDEKAAQVEKKLGNWAYESLIGVANRVNSVTASQVEAVMRSFRDDGQTGDADDESTRADTASMAELIEG